VRLAGRREEKDRREESNWRAGVWRKWRRRLGDELHELADVVEDHGVVDGGLHVGQDVSGVVVAMEVEEEIAHVLGVDVEFRFEVELEHRASGTDERRFEFPG
jgi:hypothetical protein